MSLKEGDFIELNFVGKLSDGSVFDTTLESVAKEHSLNYKSGVFKPMIVCIGKGQLVKGLDKALVGLDLGKHSINVSKEEGFGKKDAKLLQLVPSKFFKKNNIRPVAGLSVDIDGSRGIIRSVSGGRIVVDFNNPMSGHDLVFEVELLRKVVDLKEKVSSILDFMQLPADSISVNGFEVIISFKFDLPDEYSKFTEKTIKEYCSDINVLKFVTVKS